MWSWLEVGGWIMTKTDQASKGLVSDFMWFLKYICNDISCTPEFMVTNVSLLVIITMIWTSFMWFQSMFSIKNPILRSLLTFPNTRLLNSSVSDAIFSRNGYLWAALRPTSFGNYDLDTSTQIWPDLSHSASTALPRPSPKSEVCIF